MCIKAAGRTDNANHSTDLSKARIHNIAAIISRICYMAAIIPRICNITAVHSRIHIKAAGRMDSANHSIDLSKARIRNIAAIISWIRYMAAAISRICILWPSFLGSVLCGRQFSDPY